MVLFIREEVVHISPGHSSQFLLHPAPFHLDPLDFVFQSDDSQDLFQPPGTKFDCFHHPAYLLITDMAGGLNAGALAYVEAPGPLVLTVEEDTNARVDNLDAFVLGSKTIDVKA